jgi:Questin oxidase-like
MNEAIDEALERLRGMGMEMVGGMPNHGPMAVEALAALGHGTRAVDWADRYSRSLGRLPDPVSPLTGETWRGALGEIERTGDWIAYFRLQLAEAPWRSVFAEWIGRLLPGAITAGTHGLIRAAHAMRALEDGETQLRIEELGVSLAYWAAYYRELPGTPHLTGALNFGQALDKIQRFTRGRERRGMPREFILQVIASHAADFSEAVNSAAEPESPEEALSAITEAGAQLYLANATHHPLIFIHTVTAPAALRILLRHLSVAQQMVALGRVWQAVAAEVAAYGDEIAVDRSAPVLVPTEEIVERSVETGDPHAFKFVEACLREFHHNPHPAYLDAAQDWAMRLDQAKRWSLAQREAAGIDFLP